MLNAVLNEKGNFVLPSEAVQQRDAGDAHVYRCLCHDMHVNPRRGVERQPSDPHGSLRVERRPHFFHPEGIALPPRRSDLDIARTTIDAIIRRTGDFLTTGSGKLVFQLTNPELLQSQRRVDYDLPALYFQKGKTAYAVLVFASTPHSGHYMNALRFSMDDSIEKVLENGDHTTRLPDQLYMTTVLIKNNELYRPNREERHPENALKLNDWQAYDLMKLGDAINFFNPETFEMEVTSLRRWEHTCKYARSPYRTQQPEGGPLECRQATALCYDLFSLEPTRVKAGTFKIGNTPNPQIGIGKIAPRNAEQGLLF